MPLLRNVITLGTLALICAPAGSDAADPALTLSLPLDCVPGSTCFVQQYFDHDPGPAAKDYRCGSRVYDGHDGVDIRLPSVAAQRRGVGVLAAAAGTVRAVRNGEADRLVETDADRVAIKGRECGNGVVIVHPGGWETQYCHMARGSASVIVGEHVKAGDRLGLVGLSGDTQFPHLHLSVRQGQRKVDPFAPEAAANACGRGGGPTLWSAPAGAALAYRETEIINLGFSAGPLTMADLDSETIARPDRAAAAMVVYGRAIGLQAGDQVVARIVSPANEVLAENATVLDRDKAQWMSFAGLRRPAAGWRPGAYRGTWRVLRGGKVAVEKDAVLAM